MVWRSGDASQACRCGGVEVWNSGAREACCRCRDVEEAERYEDLEMRRRRVDVEV